MKLSKFISSIKTLSKHLLYLSPLCLILLLFRTEITDFCFKYIGSTFFSQVYSSLNNDILVIITAFISAILCFKNLRHRKMKFNISSFSMSVIITIIYFWYRSFFQEHYTPFYLKSDLYYMDSLWFVSFIYLLLFSFSKISNRKLETNIQTINEYLSSSKVDHAILLEGKWGTGKSYYWKNTLTKRLQDSGYKVIYVSVYGIKDVIDLQQKIEKQIHPFATHPFWNTLSKSFLKIFGLDWNNNDNIAIVNSLNLDCENIVFCFDDIERTSKGELRPILGYINTFIEQGQAHVFLICNEDKISKDEQEVYVAYKEKLVRHTIKFNVNFSETFDNIISNTGNIYLSSENARYLKMIYWEYKCLNLRILEYNKNIIQKMYPLLSEYEEKYSAPIQKYYLFLSAFYSMVYQEFGTKILLKVTDVTSGPQYELDLGVSNSERETPLTEEDIETNKVVNGIKDRIRSCLPQEKWGESKALLEYIKTSSWDPDLLRKEIDIIIKSYLIKNEENALLDILNNPFDTEDQQLQESVDKAIIKIKNGELKFSYYPEFYNRITFLQNNEFITTQYDKTELKKIFLEGIEKVNIQYMEEFDSLMSVLEHENPSKECLDIINILKSKNRAIGLKNKETKTHEILTHPENWGLLYGDSQKRTYIYNNINAREFFLIFVGAANSQKRMWVTHLHKLIENNNIVPEEYPFLREMLTLCEEKYKSTTNSITHRYYKYVVDEINKILPKDIDSTQS